jgi:regulator of replication initiation timing
MLDEENIEMASNEQSDALMQMAEFKEEIAVLGKELADVRRSRQELAERERVLTLRLSALRLRHETAKQTYEIRAHIESEQAGRKGRIEKLKQVAEHVEDLTGKKNK